MAAPKAFGLDGLKPGHSDICTIEATVVTGFEQLAKDECAEKLHSAAVVSRGRIIFDVNTEQISEVMRLRSVDSVYVIIQDVAHFGFPKDKDEAMVKIRSSANDCDWEKGLKVWQSITGFKGKIQNSEEKKDSEGQDKAIKQEKDPSSENGYLSEDSNPSRILSFRVTCNRVGKNHSFGSPEAAAHMGGAVFNMFRWKVDMTKFDLEVVLNICDEHLYVGLALTRESLHRRNIEHFGPTTLRATIAYNLLRLGSINQGDIVCDPMCGGGSIPIEAAINWRNAHHLCGDIHQLATTRTKQNLDAFNAKQDLLNKPRLHIDMFQWDATRLPIKDEFVDVVVTDLPFGKRSGSKFDNRVLYPKVMKEITRVCKHSTGRAVFLTQDKKSIIKTLQKFSKYWKNSRTLSVNIGGLAGGVYLLHRTSDTFTNHNK